MPRNPARRDRWLDAADAMRDAFTSLPNMKTRALCLPTCLAFLLLPLLPAAAWDDGGHLLTARIAFDRLAPEKQAKLRAELAGLSIGARDFSDPCAAATYMDAVRSASRRSDTHARGAFEGMFRDWHFVRMEWTPDGGPLPVGLPEPDGHADVLRGWRWCAARYLSREEGAFTYAGNTWRVGPPEALALLMHLTGDAHQPLHTTSHALPSGSDDSGGNGVEVDNASGVNLHSFWDSAYRRRTYIGRRDILRVGEDDARKPPRGGGVDDPMLGEIARTLVAESGLSEAHLAAEARKLDPAGWIRESHARGVEDGYIALGAELGLEKVNLTPAYVENAKTVAAVRITLAGVRLAAVLDALLDGRPPGGGPAAPEAKTRFAVLGNFDGRWPQTQALARMIREWKPDFILTVGDNTARAKSGSTAIYQDVVALFPEHIRPPNAPDAGATQFFPTLGIHDYESSGSGIFKPRIDEYAATFALPKSGDGLHYYDVVRGPVHCFALDSNQVRVRDSATRKLVTAYDQTALGSEQEKWFREHLAASTAPWKIAYFHQPPNHSSTEDGSGSRAMRAWKLPEAGLTAIFAGHAHGYERMEQNKTGLFVSGLGGAALHPFHTEPAKLAPGSKKRFPDPLPPKAAWPQQCGALFVEATEKEIRFEFRTVGSAEPIDKWSVKAP